MTKKSYQIISFTLPCILLITLTFINYSNLGYLCRPILPILALLSFFLGLYFLKAKIKTNKNVISPIWLILNGALFIVFSYAPAIMSYSFTHDLPIDFETPEKLHEFKEITVNPEVELNVREFWAGYIYETKGQRVNFMNSNGEVTVYSPSTLVENKRQEHLKWLAEVNNNKSVAFINFVYHLVIFVVSLFIFIVAIKLKPPNPESFATKSSKLITRE